MTVDTTTTNAGGEGLLPQHQAKLTASGISAEVIAQRGYRSATRKTVLRDLGFSQSQLIVPSLVIPQWNVHGEVGLHQSRPDCPRNGRNGRVIKYETPGKSHLIVDVPPAAREFLGNPHRPLFITEGSKKADCAVSHGLCCVALLGVWGWRGTNELGGKLALPDLEYIAVNGRKVYLVFDSDVMEKQEVHACLARLKALLDSREADTRVIYLPPGPGGQKVGLDDYLAAGRNVEDLLTLATAELRPLPGKEKGEAAHAYRQTSAGIVWSRPGADGTSAVPLTNFQARIISESVEDDGAETRRLFEVEVVRGGRTRHCSVAAGAFDNLGWVSDSLGAGAIIYPGPATRDHTRAAIKLLSGEVPEQLIYTSTGWRKLESGEWAYLHGGGAIGADSGENVTVRLGGALQGYTLPAPPEGKRLREAVTASLGLRGLTHDRSQTLPVIAAIYRAAITPADFSLHFSGTTGAFKTELASLAQQHFGAAMDSRHLPGNWSSTENSLEDTAFHVACALFVIDEFTPTGTTADVQRLHAKAERVLRGQGNRSGRGRLRADGAQRPAKPPRGLILVTGEDVPTGASLRSRIFIIEFGLTDIDPDKLTACQDAGAAGLFAAAMSGFLAWLAPRYAQVLAGMPARLKELRQKASRERNHRRTPGIVADLAFGFDLLCGFCRDAGVLTEAESASLWEKGWAALGAAASRQRAYQQASDPVRRFLELLAAAIASGRVHVTSTAGAQPENPGGWGWRRDASGSRFAPEWHAYGRRVGWVEGDDLYLNPEEALACVRRMGGDGGDGITISGPTLHRRLRERGMLVTVDKPRQTLTVRKTLDGKRTDVLHLLAARITYGKPDQPDQSELLSLDASPTVPDEGDDWSGSWSGFGLNGTETRPENPTTSLPEVPDEAALGLNGRVGRVLHTYDIPPEEADVRDRGSV